MNVRLNIVWLVALTAGLGMYGLSLAQEGQPLTTSEQPTSEQLPPQAGSANSLLSAPSLESPYGASMPGMPGRASLAPSIRQAAEAVRDAEGPTAKADAQAKLTDYLAKYFDDDMVRRQKELDQIEQRVAKLRELLDRRRNRKEEIIELQAKVALNEAEGLGFYEGERTDDLRANLNSGLAPPTAEPAGMRRQ